MLKNKLISTATIVGASLLIIMSTSQNAQAANVTPSCTITTPVTGTGLNANIYSVPNGDCAPPSGWNPKLFAWEGRAGAPGGADYEFALGDNGANVNNNNSQPQSIYRDWTSADNNNPIPWSVDYNSTTGVATFTIDSISRNYTSTTNTGSTPFNAFSIAAKVTPADSKIVSNVRATLTVLGIESGANFVNFVGSNALADADNNVATTRPNFNQILVSTSAGEAITRVTGNVLLNWPGTSNPNTSSARGRVGFLFQAFDPPVTEATPEPLTILGSLTALAMGASLKRKLAKK